MPLGEWVLRTAAPATVLAWPSIALSVNGLLVRLCRTDLVDMVSDVLAEIRLEPERLDLEIGADALLEEEGRAHAVLGTLKPLRRARGDRRFRLGLLLAGSPAPFRIQAIKIDRRFVADLDDETGREAVMPTILALGRSLDMSVSPRGVKITGQLLLSLGRSSEVRGFLLAAPMPAADISALLTQEAQSNCPALDQAPSSKSGPDQSHDFQALAWPDARDDAAQRPAQGSQVTARGVQE